MTLSRGLVDLWEGLIHVYMTGGLFLGGNCTHSLGLLLNGVLWLKIVWHVQEYHMGW